uniref:Uncharacterized protein n=1 Tax=Rhizophora mucronata TaxID=61149 RepID=A0A2P2IZN6_RHIMU
MFKSQAEYFDTSACVKIWVLLNPRGRLFMASVVLSLTAI